MLDLIQAYEKYMAKVKHASDNTIASYMRDIRQFSTWLKRAKEKNIIDATRQNISEYLSALKDEGRSLATVSRCLASLKNFYAYLVTSGFLESTPVVDLHMEHSEKKPLQILTGREIELLLAQPASVDAKGCRDKAMLERMYATGIRVTELINLDLEDVNLDLGIIKCTSAKQTRSIPLYPAALKALKAYLQNIRNGMIASSDEQALFVNINGVRMSRQGFWKILKQYQKLLSLDEVKLEFSEDALHAIAAKAMKKDTGARALRSIIEEFMLDIMYEIPKDDNIGIVTITKEYVEGTGAPMITMRGQAKLPVNN